MGKSWSRLRRSNDRIQTANLWGIPTVWGGEGGPMTGQGPTNSSVLTACSRRPVVFRFRQDNQCQTRHRVDAAFQFGLPGGFGWRFAFEKKNPCHEGWRTHLWGSAYGKLSHWWVRFGAEVYQTSWTEGIDVLSKDAIWAMKMTLLIWII